MSIQESAPEGTYGSVEQPHLERPSRKCCTVKYRPRYFYSKGAFLVLLWVTLLGMTTVPLCTGFGKGLLNAIKLLGSPNASCFLLIIFPLFICILLTGWLADTKVGNYKVFKAGAMLAFSATTVGSLALAIECFMPRVVTGALIVSGSLGIFGVITCVSTALQLGLDQMPDASAVNISSFIVWFVVSLFAGIWAHQMFLFVINNYHGSQNAWKLIVIFLQPAICLMIVCSTMFLLAPKYLLIEPKSPQSLKIIYRVFKFAAKHKAPLNRSALTYWEEDIPSRLDLGKSRYGGPFTTEQVEDVKTFFKMLLILFPIILIGLASTLGVGVSSIINTTHSNNPFQIFSMLWWISVSIYELIIYPFVRNKLPRILKGIGCISILILLVKCLYIADSAVTVAFETTSINYTSNVTVDVQHLTTVVLDFIDGSLALFLLIVLLEFLCAQSPYSMRGLFTSCCSVALLFSLTLWTALQTFLSSHVMFIFITRVAAVLLCLIGFILYCVLARWYKLRVRDEEYNVHRVVEEVYDRYLSQRQ